MSERPEWELRVDEAVQKLNLKWYKDDDRYSDGDVEEDIVRYIAQNKPEDYGKIIYENLDWAVYYHLSNVRRNLLNWYPFRKEGSVLEIGAGCGAITGLLCDKCQKVTAVELSKRRATATQVRCREKNNLEVIVGNLNDIEFEEKFDYITLIGVLEYQGTYTDSDNPYKDFLVKIKSLLKDGGKLLIAIENKYGMKYWCGAVEDHTGIPFDGLNQYKFSGGKVRTFAKAELTELLVQSGYMNSFYYYPMPDYKLPTVVYSEKYMPRNENMEFVRPYYIPSDKTLLVEEKGLYRDIIKNNAFGFFANSFLVECSPESAEGTEKEGQVIFALLNNKRQKEYRTGTLIRNSGKVIKFALEGSMDMNPWFSQIMSNAKKMQEQGLKVLPYYWSEEIGLTMDYVTFPVLEDFFRHAAAQKDTDAIWNLWDRVLGQIEAASESAEQEECIIYELGLDEYGEQKDYGKILKEGYLDMVPKNCFMNGEELLWYDQEWTLDNVPAKFVLYRAMVETYTSISELNEVIPTTEFIKHYGMDGHLEVFMALNELFLQMVMDNFYVGNVMENNDKFVYRRNIFKLL